MWMRVYVLCCSLPVIGPAGEMSHGDVRKWRESVASRPYMIGFELESVAEMLLNHVVCQWCPSTTAPCQHPPMPHSACTQLVGASRLWPVGGCLGAAGHTCEGFVCWPAMTVRPGGAALLDDRGSAGVSEARALRAEDQTEDRTSTTEPIG